MFFYIETNYLPYIIRPDQNLDLFDVLQLGNRTNRKKGFSFYRQENWLWWGLTDVESEGNWKYASSGKFV